MRLIILVILSSYLIGCQVFSIPKDVAKQAYDECVSTCGPEWLGFVHLTENGNASCICDIHSAYTGSEDVK